MSQMLVVLNLHASQGKYTASPQVLPENAVVKRRTATQYDPPNGAIDVN